MHGRFTIFYVQPHTIMNVYNDEDVNRLAREMLAMNKLGLFAVNPRTTVTRCYAETDRVVVNLQHFVRV